MVILVSAVIQGIWYALSINPVLFDGTTRHINFIMFYTVHIQPFISVQTRKAWIILGGSLVIHRIWTYLVTMLFIERPLINIVVYGSRPNPPICQPVIGDERCKSFRDYVVY